MALPVIGGSRYIEPRCIFCQEVLSKTIVFILNALVLTKIFRYNIICTCMCGFSFGNKFREYFSGVTGVRKICIL